MFFFILLFPPKYHLANKFKVLNYDLAFFHFSKQAQGVNLPVYVAASRQSTWSLLKMHLNSSFYSGVSRIFLRIFSSHY